MAIAATASGRWKQSATGGTRTYFYYSGDTLIGSTSDATGSSSGVYLWGADGLIGTQSRSTAGVVSSSYNLYDARGNLAQTVDGTGAVSPAASYTAWGEVVPRADGTVPSGRYGAKFGYLRDAETGFYLCTYRHYDPSAGRWLTRDPIGYAGGSNLYGYVANDPANLTDPSGLLWQIPVAVGAVWAVYEIGSSPYDAYDTGRVLTDPRVSPEDKGIASGLFVGGLVGPGGGYGAASRLPLFKGAPHRWIRKQLRKCGFTKTKVSSAASQNETWNHLDGSEVRIHPYGNQYPSGYKSGNNAHAHKDAPGKIRLNDQGRPAADAAEQHIGIPNPPNLPSVRGRPHRDGS